MAINALSHGNVSIADTFDFNCKEVAIGGKLVMGKICIPESADVNFADHEMKEYVRTSMAIKLAEHMMANGLVEFTYMVDRISFDRVVYARCYLAPNEQVKILRIKYDNK
jgi:hypothetical protein